MLNPDGTRVGPGNPPFEHRWKKGLPSPNPSGRPSKEKRFVDTFSSLEPHLARIIAFDQTVIGTASDGTPITRGDSIDAALGNLSLRDFRAMQLYLERRDEAYRFKSEFMQKMLIAAADHIDTHLANVLQLDAMGKEAKVLPHPLDVIIGPGGVKIVGPTTELERMAMKGAVKLQAEMRKVAMGSLCCEGPASLKDRREIWVKLRRRYYRLNKIIPPRLRVSFPGMPQQ